MYVWSESNDQNKARYRGDYGLKFGSLKYKGHDVFKMLSVIIATRDVKEFVDEIIQRS